MNLEIAREFAGSPRQKCGRDLYLAVETERRELAAHRAAFFRNLRNERIARELRLWVSLWPVAAGLLLWGFAPAVKAFVAGRAPWAMPAVFPFFTLACRPEVALAGRIARALPSLPLFAQFLVEKASRIVQALPSILFHGQFLLDGLFAWILLRHRATVAGVCGQVSCLHALGILQLWLLNGGLNRILAG
jgi:hypothetical protein